MESNPNCYWNPYVGGVALGLVLLTTYIVMGWGLGASGANFRIGAWIMNSMTPSHVESVPALQTVVGERHPLDHWISFEILGVMIGGFIGAWSSGRLKREVLKREGFPTWQRIALAVAGGLLMGFGAKLARGCAAGQGLSGGAILSVGGWAFMLSFFTGGYAMAYFVRRQWR
jgi:hypothetical protein